MSNRASKITVGAVALVMTVLGSVVGAAWGAAMYAGKIDRSFVSIVDHENRLRIVEAQAQGMAADLQWIRRYLETVASANGATIDGNSDQ